MTFRYTDEQIPKRPAQGGKASRSVFDAEGAARKNERESRERAVCERMTGEKNGRWKMISQEELLGPCGIGPRQEQTQFIALIRMIRDYQVTDEGRRSAFLEQARWMESYEEEGRISNTEFCHQYVGYQEMDKWELHAYFSWRTRFRRKERVPYCFEFLRLHAAELINLIGVSDSREAFDRLLNLQAETVPGNSLQRGAGLPGDSLQRRAGLSGDSLRRGTGLAGRSFEGPEADRKKLAGILSGFLIARAADFGQNREELLEAYCVPDQEREADNITLLYYEESDDASVFRVISNLTSNRIHNSMFLCQAGEDAWRVIARVFRQVCITQKKTGSLALAERLLGTRRVLRRDLFPMTPYKTRAEEGYTVEVTPATSWQYKEGSWYRSDYPLLRDERAIRELNDLVRECERVLRKKLHYRNQLQDRMKNPVLAKMISEETDRWLKEKTLRNRPQVRVDLSRLGAIRDLAAITRERLLEGTEEGMQADDWNDLMNGPADEKPDTVQKCESEGRSSSDYGIGSRPDTATGKDADAGGGRLFSSQETVFLKLLLDGGNGADFLRGHKILPSVFVDAINEKAYEEIGDSIVEESGRGFQLVEDYIEDVRDLL